jgi:hypothetical protein
MPLWVCEADHRRLRDRSQTQVPPGAANPSITRNRVVVSITNLPPPLPIISLPSALSVSLVATFLDVLQWDLSGSASSSASRCTAFFLNAAAARAIATSPTRST